HFVTPHRRDQFRSSQENRRSILKLPGRPFFVGLERSLNCLCDFLCSSPVPRCKNVPVTVWHHRLRRSSGLHLLAVNEQRDFDLLTGLQREALPKSRPFGGARCKRSDRLVHGPGNFHVEIICTRPWSEL